MFELVEKPQDESEPQFLLVASGGPELCRARLCNGKAQLDAAIVELRKFAEHTTLGLYVMRKLELRGMEADVVKLGDLLLMHQQRMNRAIAVEQHLLDAARGKRPLPDADECRMLANVLGVPKMSDVRPAS
jgi:hypothetical protein